MFHQKLCAACASFCNLTFLESLISDLFAGLELVTSNHGIKFGRRSPGETTRRRDCVEPPGHLWIPELARSHILSLALLAC